MLVKIKPFQIDLPTLSNSLPFDNSGTHLTSTTMHQALIELDSKVSNAVVSIQVFSQTSEPTPASDGLFIWVNTDTSEQVLIHRKDGVNTGVELS